MNFGERRSIRYETYDSALDSEHRYIMVEGVAKTRRFGSLLLVEKERFCFSSPHSLLADEKVKIRVGRKM